MRPLLLALVLSTTSAFAACPDLSGKYPVCRSTTGQSSGSTDNVYTQKTVNGVTTYTMTSTSNDDHQTTTDSVQADGRIYTSTQTDPETNMTITMSQRYTCGNGTLLGSANISMQNEAIGNLNTVTTKAGKTLTMKMTGNLMGQDVSDSIICE
jgi:hypothetical protein